MSLICFFKGIGGSFWIFYVPAMSSINGLEDQIQEIESSAFVKCKIVSVLYSDDTEAWVKVLVSEVKPLKEFSGYYRKGRKKFRFGIKFMTSKTIM